MKVGSRVKLDTFHGTKTAPPGCDPKKNYWKLIGVQGVVVQDPFTCCKYERFNNERSVLVKFDSALESLGLCCNDSAENSLWIPAADLLIVN